MNDLTSAAVLRFVGITLDGARGCLRGPDPASMQALSREVCALGYRKLSARPKHRAQAIGAVETFKKTSPPRWQASRASRTSTR